MARIDSLIHHLFEFGADALGIGAGHQVVLMAQGERRPITAAPMRAEQVRALVDEIITAEQKARLAIEGQLEITYPAASGRVRIEVQNWEASPRMIVSRTAAVAEPAPPPVPEDPGTYEMPKTGDFNLNDPSMAELKALVDAHRSAPSAPKALGTNRASSADGPRDLRPDIAEPVAGTPTPLDPYLQRLVEKGGSDLYICSGKPPLIRRDGDLVVLGDPTPLTLEQATFLLFSICSTPQRQNWLDTRDVDLAYEIPGLARFRGNIFEDRRGIGGIFRQIPNKILSSEDLGIPPAILKLCHLSKGLVLVTGPTGSGKSTTLAAMIDYINRSQPKHIITIEDPIEFVHEDKRCVVNQRQVGSHTKSFKRALKSALREDPDIVLVGELRDLETMEIAIETAETGHLVFGTLHTNTAASTVDRIIDQFPADRQAQIRTMMSEALKGVVSQVLVKKKGGGRAAALEILIVTASVANIIREGKTFQLPSIMQTGKAAGMVTMADALLNLAKSGLCAPADVIDKAINREEMRGLLQRNQIAVE